MFTRKHFNLVAGLLKGLRDLPIANAEDNEAIVTATLDATSEAFADTFAGLNGQFDRDRFLRACGLGTNSLPV